MARGSAANAASTSVTPESPGEGGALSVEEVVAGIGPRLADLRAGMGLSLQQMSAIAEVSAASIHKIERGDMVPTITTLLKLATVFKRPISHLIGEEPDDPHDVWHVASGTGEPVDRGGADVVLISGPPARFRARGTTIKLPAGAVLEDAPARGGEALVHVMAGAVHAKIGGRDFSLKRGDSLHFLSDNAATWTNSGRAAAELVHVSVS
jgi:DNA-binding XRE family transcriptional regulator/quercetin dioxygenase-like cupin family protein